MARYIDADALIKKIYPMGIGDGKYTINAKAVKFAIDNIPTADVVPKSEVERLEKILDSYAFQYGTVTDKQAIIDHEKGKVAREIFEEIKDLLKSYTVVCDDKWWKGNLEELLYEVLPREFAELKKKYTGDAE